MDLQQQPDFTSAVKEIMKDGISALTLSLEEIFYLANDICPPQHQITYGNYMRFIEGLNQYDEPTTPSPQTSQMMEVYHYLKAQEARQKRAMLAKIQEGQKDWRRFVWLLQQRQREERIALAKAKQKERERKEQQRAAEAAAKHMEVMDEPCLQPLPKGTPVPETGAEPPKNPKSVYVRKAG